MSHKADTQIRDNGMALEDYIKALREASQTTGFAECFIETGEAPTHHLKEWMLEDWGFERRTLSSRTFTLTLAFPFAPRLAAGYVDPHSEQARWYLSHAVWLWERALDGRNAA